MILTTYCKSKSKSIIALKIVSIEMKQTAAVNLGIIRLNEDFVQLNEIMSLYSSTHFKRIQVANRQILLQSQIHSFLGHIFLEVFQDLLIYFYRN